MEFTSANNPFAKNLYARDWELTTFAASPSRLRKKFNNGWGNERATTFLQFLKVYQNGALLSSTREGAELLYVACLDGMMTLDVASRLMDSFNDIDQLIINGLEKVLFSECEKLASAEQNSPEYVHICTSENQAMYKLIGKLRPIYSCLEGKVKDINDELFHKATMLFFQDKFEASWSIFSVLSNSSNEEIRSEVRTVFKYFPLQIQSGTFSGQPKIVLQKAILRQAIEPGDTIYGDAKEMFQCIQSEQYERFSIPKEDSVESRVQLGKHFLLSSCDALNTHSEGSRVELTMGVDILEPLTKLDGPAAVDAKEILDNWLNKAENRIQLIIQYGRNVLLPICRGASRNEEWKFKAQIGILLQQAQTLKEQGKVEAAQQLVYQLIEAAIAIKFIGRSYPKCLKIRSSFYQLLKASPVLDDICRKEVLMRLDAVHGERYFSNFRDNVNFNAPNRPLANHELGLIYLEKGKGEMSYLKEAYAHFQKALDDGYLPAQEQLEKMLKSIPPLLIVAEDSIRKHKERGIFSTDLTHLNYAISCYQLIATFGNDDAHEKYLKYASQRGDEKKGDEKAQLAWGKKGLDRVNSLSEDDEKNYITSLEKASNSTDKDVVAEAHFMLAQFYAATPSRLTVAIGFPGKKVISDRIENAAKHYKHSVESGHKEAGRLEITFLKKQMPMGSTNFLDEDSKIIIRLREIAGSSDKEVAQQAALILVSHYSKSIAGIFSIITKFDPKAEAKKYEEIARKLGNDIAIANRAKSLSVSATDAQYQIKSASDKHTLAENYLQGTGVEQSDAKAVELFIQAVDLGNLPSRKALLKMVETTISGEAQYKLSQVIDTLLMDESGEDGDKLAHDLLVKAAENGYSDARMKLKAKEEMKAAIEQAVKEQALKQAQIDLQKLALKVVGRSSKYNTDWYPENK